MERWIVAAVVVVLLVTVAVAAPPSSLPIVPGDDSGGTATASPAPTSNTNTNNSNEEEGTVPSLPVEWQAMSCELHLSGISLGGLNQACHKNHRRHHHHHHSQDLHSRCCPVLAAWLYAAEAETIMEAIAATSSSSSPSSSSSSSSGSPQVEMPVPPDDSAVCAAGLQQGLHSRGIDLPLLNASCDMSLCYCGIRLRQMASLSCPLGYFHRNKSAALASSAPFLQNLQRNCSDSSHTGCTSCISALDNSMIWIQQKTKKPESPVARSPTADCRLMGLMWLLSNNRTRFIPTVSAVLRALLYTDQSEQHDPAALCSPDDAGMPLAIDSSEFSDGDSSSAKILAVSTKIFVFLWLLLFLLQGSM